MPVQFVVWNIDRAREASRPMSYKEASALADSKETATRKPYAVLPLRRAAAHS